MQPDAISLAILFADVSGSTRLYETLGDKAALERIERCLALLGTVAHRHQGEVVKTIGDEIMCTFPDAPRAVEAACAMQAEMTAHAAAGGLPLHIRIGLHLGEAIREDADVFGDAVNVASRMAGLAKADQIITTRHTVDRLPPVLRADTRCLGRAPVKGKREEIEICEIIWQQGGDLTLMPAAVFKGAALAKALTLRHGEAALTLGPSGPPVTLGREQDCDLVVNDPLASRRHARIEFRGGKFVLSDESTNGTYLTTTEGRKIFLHREAFPLTGSGALSLGHDADPASPLAILYVCEE